MLYSNSVYNDIINQTTFQTGKLLSEGVMLQKLSSSTIVDW